MILLDSNPQLKFRASASLGVAVRTTPLIVVARGCALLVYIYLAYSYGIGRFTAPLFYAWGVVTSLGMILGTAVEQAFVPISLYSGQSIMLRTLRRLTMLLVALMGLLAVLGPVALHFASAFRESSIREVQLLLLAFTPGLVFQLWNSALRGIWTARGEFRFVAMSNLIEGVLQVAVTIACLRLINLYAVPVGITAGGLVSFVRLRWHCFEDELGNHEGARAQVELRMGKFLLAQILGTAMVSLNPLIDQTFAALLDESAVTVMAYAARFFLIPSGLLISGYLPVFLSVASRQFRDREHDALYRRAYRNLAVAGAISATLSFLVVACLNPAVSMLRAAGQPMPLNLGSTVQTCQILLAGTAPYILMVMLGKLHIACMNYRAIWIGSILNVLVNVALDAALYRRLGVSGIALATTLDYTVVAFVLFWLFTRARVSVAMQVA